MAEEVEASRDNQEHQEEQTVSRGLHVVKVIDWQSNNSSPKVGTSTNLVRTERVYCPWLVQLVPMNLWRSFLR